MIIGTNEDFSPFISSAALGFAASVQSPAGAPAFYPPGLTPGEFSPSPSLSTVHALA